MANFSSVRNSSKKKSVVGGIVKFKFVVEKLQKRLILLGRNKEGCDSSKGLGGKFLVPLELPAGRVVFGVGTWGASLWVGALGCTGAELEAFPV